MISSSPSYLIIAPQFLIVGDNCWYQNKLNKVTLEFSCGLPIYTCRGWKEGASNVNDNYVPSIFSYDILNQIISRVGNTNYFPNVKKIILFGFSAGAQMLQRYALVPKLDTVNAFVRLSFVISDPSSYVYFTNERPTGDGKGFNIPDSSWMKSEWNSSSGDGNSSWITTWDPACAKFNNWRFGFDNVIGYAREYFNKFDYSSAISAYSKRDITYLIGREDTCNCKLNAFEEKCLDDAGVCHDFELATYCSGTVHLQ
jgi:hypothetical protein